MFPEEEDLNLDIQRLLSKMQITTTTTTTTTEASTTVEAGEAEATEASEVVARRKRSVPEGIKREGVNKFIPRELLTGIKPLNASKDLLNATYCDCSAVPGTRLRKQVVLTDLTWKPDFAKLTSSTFKYNKGEWENEINMILAGNGSLRSLGFAGATVLSAELTGVLEQEEVGARRKRAAAGVTFNAILSLDVEIVLAADYNDTTRDIIDESYESELQVRSPPSSSAAPPPTPCSPP